MAERMAFPKDLLAMPMHENLLGTSAAISEVNALVQRLAKSNLTVLITGESGTGKDIAARMLHRLSPRASKPFIKVNCPAVPEGIMESELFGHEKGAFTGARSSKPGRLELAHLGSIFLDEIAETPLGVQGKLLQLLDGEPIMRIGGVQPIQCDVRIIAATNMILEDAVREERMREDIYFRLSEVHIHIPPLRDRAGDIPLLAEHFNYNNLQKLGRDYTPLPQEYVQKMQALSWRGNVRELAGCVKKYVATENPETLLGEETEERNPASPIQMMPRSLVAPSPPPQGRVDGPPEAPREERGRNGDGERRFMPLKEATRRAIESTERALIEEALRYTLWNRRKAARLLDISYSSLLRRIDAYNIGKSD